MSRPKLGELFAGYGGLGMAVEEVFGAELAWVSEWEEAPSKILAHHWPHVPNHGDITEIDWAAVEPVDIISGGFPCQDLSLAGKQFGMGKGTRSGLWSYMLEAIETIQPRYVVAENVRGLLSGTAHSVVEQCAWCLGADGDQSHLRALGAVLGDLADVGFDAEWRGIRASDVGAPHNRFRVFLVAENTNRTAWSERWLAAPGQAESRRPRTDAGRRAGAPAVADASSFGLEAGRLPGRQVEEVPEHHNSFRVLREYSPAVRRWEGVTRPAPAPAFYVPGKDKGTINTAFVEWMMGLPEGHVTDQAIGLNRADQLKALGNGVVPQQAMAALQDMLAAFNATEVAA
ncbi:DNA cytosine methyltransferase [Arthrobacter sp. SD76]|uniref:DNA cytosine methyltransferase n=1 Tax=Arthrobacter sp. SD76 TaxID=3415007 RepID=UPI003C73273A